MKKMIPLVIMAAALGLPGMARLHAADEGYNALVNHAGGWTFISGSVSRSKLTQIINAGGRAPSASNRQPWHFTVVQNGDLGRRILPAFLDGNVLIVVSAQGDGKTNSAEILDCALAVESMYLAAQALGLGSRIYTGPISSLNSNLKEALELPGGYNAVALVRVGQVNLSADAVTTVSPRKSLNTIVTYK